MGRPPGHKRWFIGHPHHTTLELDRLAGAHGPRRDIVLVNAAAALVAAWQAETFLEGMALGAVSIDSGAARGKVEALAGLTE